MPLPLSYGAIFDRKKHAALGRSRKVESIRAPLTLIKLHYSRPAFQGHSELLKRTWIDAFLLTIHSNNGPISYRFQDTSVSVKERQCFLMPLCLRTRC